MAFKLDSLTSELLGLVLYSCEVAPLGRACLSFSQAADLRNAVITQRQALLGAPVGR